MTNIGKSKKNISHRKKDCDYVRNTSVSKEYILFAVMEDEIIQKEESSISYCFNCGNEGNYTYMCPCLVINNEDDVPLLTNVSR